MRIETKLNPEVDAKVKEIERTIEDLRTMLFDLKISLLVNESTEGK